MAGQVIVPTCDSCGRGEEAGPLIVDEALGRMHKRCRDEFLKDRNT